MSICLWHSTKTIDGIFLTAFALVINCQKNETSKAQTIPRDVFEEVATHYIQKLQRNERLYAKRLLFYEILWP